MFIHQNFLGLTAESRSQEEVELIAEGRKKWRKWTRREIVIREAILINIIGDEYNSANDNSSSSDSVVYINDPLVSLSMHVQ